MYTGPIVDAHHHIWRVADQPWLSGPMVPRIFGPYEPIRRDYLIDEYVAEATACGITQSVYVQTNWPLDRVEDEVRWLREVHEQSGWPTAVVAAADMFADDAPRGHAAAGRAHPAGAGRAAAAALARAARVPLRRRPPDRMKDPVFRKNVGALAGLGWLFELQVFPEQMADAAELVADFPEVTFVLVHAGMLIGDADVPSWRSGLAALAGLPNVVVKLTGQGTFVHRVDRGLISLVTDEVIGRFGAGRAMFGTNFPVEKLWTTMPPTGRRVEGRAGPPPAR
ncbi:amidohydrolase family protein [Nonomuraea salmonea]|uniref:amidohydrolase family protein n=1 Tax=Nonomuraea salmonea TaxID=46181 RepID=UPI002FE8E102